MRPLLSRLTHERAVRARAVDYDGIIIIIIIAAAAVTGAGARARAQPGGRFGLI